MKASKITFIVFKDHSAPVDAALKENGITCYSLQAGRSMVQKDRQRMFGLINETILEEDLVNIYRAYVSPECQEGLVSLIAEKANLHIPGRGSIYVEETVLTTKLECLLNTPPQLAGKKEEPSSTDLMGICCIVQRGQGNPIVRSLLSEVGCVPTVTYGIGTGVRDKLGLLRIALPAEKEVIHGIVSRFDADQVMNILINVGKLDQPGKGFIYSYPVLKGILNTKVRRGRRQHAASMDQIVLALDSLKGSTEWRKIDATESQKNRKFLTDLVSLNLCVNDGQALPMVEAAMSAGASGATISRYSQVMSGDTPQTTPAREMSDLIVGKQQVQGLSDALEKAGFFGQNTAGIIETGSVPRACTYLGGKK